MELKIVDTQATDIFSALGFEGQDREYMAMLGALVFLDTYLKGGSSLERTAALARAATNLEEFILLQISSSAAFASLAQMEGDPEENARIARERVLNEIERL